MNRHFLSVALLSVLLLSSCEEESPVSSSQPPISQNQEEVTVSASEALNQKEETYLLLPDSEKGKEEEGKVLPRYYLSAKDFDAVSLVPGRTWLLVSDIVPGGKKETLYSKKKILFSGVKAKSDDEILEDLDFASAYGVPSDIETRGVYPGGRVAISFVSQGEEDTFLRQRPVTFHFAFRPHDQGNHLRLPKGNITIADLTDVSADETVYGDGILLDEGKEEADYTFNATPVSRGLKGIRFDLKIEERFDVTAEKPVAFFSQSVYLRLPRTCK